MKLARLAMGLVLAVVAPAALAAPCAGFADLDDSNPFCTNVVWLKNRGVTSGCTVGTYCPDNPVTRLQMAIFMNRLATALQPDFVSGVDLNAEAEINAQTPACETDPYTVTGFTRMATPVGATLTHAAATVNDISARLVYRTPPSTLWLDWGPISRASNQSGQYVSQSPTAGPLNLQLGETYAFGIRTIATSPAVSTAQCALYVRIENRN